MSLATMKNNILRFCPGLSPDMIASTLQSAYREIGLLDWNRLNLTRQIHTLSPYTTGQITINALGVVTGIGTSFTSSMIGANLRVSLYNDSYFQIASVASGQSLTINDWTGDVISTAFDYTIFRTIYALPIPMKVVFSVAYQTSLTKKSQEFFNQRDPERSTTGSPTWWAYSDYNVSGYPNIEIYPVPDQVYPLRIYGKAAIVTLGETDTPYLPEDLVEARALLDCFRIKQSLEPKGGWEARYAIQKSTYDTLFNGVRDEDYQLGSHRDKVKDFMETGDAYPPSDSFWVSHDVE